MHYLEGYTTIHYSPSGLLNRIAFQLLIDPNGKRLNELYELDLYTNLSDFVKQRQQPGRFTAHS